MKNNIFNSLLDLVFPPRCEVCKKSGPEALCAECFSGVKFLRPQFGIHSAAAYDGTLKSAIHRFKFQNRKKLAEPLGVLMVNYLGRDRSLPLRELDGIIPVPLHPRRLRGRGFNQAELLARVVGRYFDLPVISALARVKHTKPQFDLPREARRLNLIGAFRVNQPKEIVNKRVLLLDDIYTTGATVTECVRALSAAGARRIEVLTLSRACLP